MAKLNPKLLVAVPKNMFDKPLSIDFLPLVKAIAKGVGHVIFGKIEELPEDATETLSAIGLVREPGELAFKLIKGSLERALFELVSEGIRDGVVSGKIDDISVVEQFVLTIPVEEFYIDQNFLNRPSDIPLIRQAKSLFQEWLKKMAIPFAASAAMVDRLPSYFVYALTQEWRRNAKLYQPFTEAIATPFDQAALREWAWTAYSAYLQRRIHEGIFFEPYSLKQIFIPLNAYYVGDVPRKNLYNQQQTFLPLNAYYAGDTARKNSPNQLVKTGQPQKRVVVSLDQEIDEWLERASPDDLIRVIAGGPGSGKSSFLTILAARLAFEAKTRVLLVPLFLIDPTKDIVDEVGRFVKEEGILRQNPIDPDSQESNLLLIFDGLDELAIQGKAAAETARDFVREVEKLVAKRNLAQVKLRVLLSGRELVVQEYESEFRRPRQILTLLPYVVCPSSNKDEEYVDPNGLLNINLRKQWWKNYGELTGKGYKDLPRELVDHKELDEITAQPLLNYLVALSLSRNKLDFTRDLNSNSIYSDLVAAVHEREYHRLGRPPGIRHMTSEEFFSVLEEIGIATWHGDGRTATVKGIEERLRKGRLNKLLEAFQENAKSGVTRLLAAFFFRQHGRNDSGDATFVFTHKSFGEYLTARRIVRTLEKMVRKLNEQVEDQYEGWDEREALRYWVEICGPSPISRDLHGFLLNEIKLRSFQIPPLQARLAEIFGYMLQHGMPMELLVDRRYEEKWFLARNSEEALLVALNSCARVTQARSPIRISKYTDQDPKVFGTWLKRIQGQRIINSFPDTVLITDCLSFLGLGAISLDVGDFYRARLDSVDLRNASCQLACFHEAHLTNADLQGSKLSDANFRQAHLENVKLQKACLEGADLREAHLERANLIEARLDGAHLEWAHLEGARLEGAHLEGAHLEGASLGGAHLDRAHFELGHLKGAYLKSASLVEAHLNRAHLEEADLQLANLKGAHLQEAHLAGANLEGAKLEEVHLEGADLRGVKFNGVHFERAHLEGALLVGVNLAGAHLRGAHLGRAILEDANLEAAKLAGADLTEAKLKGSKFDWADLEGACLKGAELIGVTFAEANLTRADLSRANLEGANLETANLTGAILTGINTKGAKLPGTHK